MDRLAPFFEGFSLSARMRYSRQMCGKSGNHDSEHAGYLHVLKKGSMKIIRPNGRQIIIDTPSNVFFPHPHHHRLFAPEQEGAELVCATIECWNFEPAHGIIPGAIGR